MKRRSRSYTNNMLFDCLIYFKNALPLINLGKLFFLHDYTPVNTSGGIHIFSQSDCGIFFSFLQATT